MLAAASSLESFLLIDKRYEFEFERRRGGFLGNYEVASDAAFAVNVIKVQLTLQRSKKLFN